MEYKMIVLDLDGTLTNSKKEMTDRTRETLLTAERQFWPPGGLPMASRPLPMSCG